MGIPIGWDLPDDGSWVIGDQRPIDSFGIPDRVPRFLKMPWTFCVGIKEVTGQRADDFSRAAIKFQYTLYLFGLIGGGLDLLIQILVQCDGRLIAAVGTWPEANDLLQPVVGLVGIGIDSPVR